MEQNELQGLRKTEDELRYGLTRNTASLEAFVFVNNEMKRLKGLPNAWDMVDTEVQIFMDFHKRGIEYNQKALHIVNGQIDNIELLKTEQNENATKVTRRLTELQDIIIKDYVKMDTFNYVLQLLNDGFYLGLSDILKEEYSDVKNEIKMYMKERDELQTELRRIKGGE